MSKAEKTPEQAAKDLAHEIATQAATAADNAKAAATEVAEMAKAKARQLEPINVLYLVGSPIALAALIPLELYWHGFHWPVWIISFVYSFMTGIGVTAGYHRLFSHRTFDANPFTRAVLLLLSAGALQNSALKWSYDHRLHHKYVDTDRDPYNIKKGFWWAHMGWVFYKTEVPPVEKMPRDLTKDKLVLLQNKYYLPLALFMCFGVPTILGALYGNWFGGLIIGGLMRVQLTTHFTALINSACHYFGTQPYDKNQTARDSWWLAFFTNGEGYHNFHHYFHFDYRNGYKWYQWDPTKWTIGVLSWFGWAKNLKRATPTAIAQAKARSR